MRILIVDDDEDAPELLAELIRASGHLVRVVHDGPAALSAIADFKPRVVFLDIGLPGMDGHQVATRIREADEDIRLIALTGFRDERLPEFDERLIKPLDYGALERVLEQFA